MCLREFLFSSGTIFDVRSPSEYTQGHIPGAVSLPLFNDEERVRVGTVYKQKGKEEAVELGLELVGPKLSPFVRAAKKASQGMPAKIYCWRGGMRSSSVAWLLHTAGLKTLTLAGGYKKFRSWALKEVHKPLNIRLLGGMTGSGKTEVLHALAAKGEQVLDLEGLACHRGSAFGFLGSQRQPSNEQFENEIAKQLASFDQSKPIWLEDESRTIGSCKIPDALFDQMRLSPLMIINKQLETRIEQLLLDYAGLPAERLIESTRKISKKLGGERTKQIIDCIQTHQFAKAVELLLYYYDKTYTSGLNSRSPNRRSIEATGLCADDIANILINY